MVHVKVPATTANMGPGFDSIGMAFNIYNNAWVEEISSGLTIESKNSFCIPQDETNLIYRSMLMFHDETGIPRNKCGVRIIQEDHIPIARGLGSSAACIVAGLMAENALYGSRLTKKEIAEIAAKIEGHPDNSTPAILGGMIVGAMEEERLNFIKISIDKLIQKGVKFGVMIPAFTLSTEKARSVLPSLYSRQDVVFNASRAALLVAAVITGDIDKLFCAMDDCVHQPYREKLIPGMGGIFNKARELGALGVFLSGAGPTLIALYNSQSAKEGLTSYISSLKEGWALNELEADEEGATVKLL